MSARACGMRVGITRELAKDLQHEMASIRVHFRRQARNADRWKVGGASRPRAAAQISTNSTASGLHRPPVSKATTTRRHLSPESSSAYFLSLSDRSSFRGSKFRFSYVEIKKATANAAQ